MGSTGTGGRQKTHSCNQKIRLEPDFLIASIKLIYKINSHDKSEKEKAQSKSAKEDQPHPKQSPLNFGAPQAMDTFLIRTK